MKNTIFYNNSKAMILEKKLKEMEDKMNSLFKAIDLQIDEDGGMRIKINGDVYVETGNLILFSKDGQLVTSHKLTHINPVLANNRTKSIDKIANFIKDEKDE